MLRPLPFPGSESEPLPLSTCSRAKREAVVSTELRTAEAMAQTVELKCLVSSDSWGGGDGEEEEGKNREEEEKEEEKGEEKTH